MIIQDVTESYLRNAVPGNGTITFESGYRKEIHPKEIAIGNWIYRTFGGDIVFLQEDKERSRKTPDYAWNGKAWELKSISSAKAADSALRVAVKQIHVDPGGVIFELADGIDQIDLERTLADRFRRIPLDELDILIIMHDFTIKVLRYIKK